MRTVERVVKVSIDKDTTECNGHHMKLNLICTDSPPFQELAYLLANLPDGGDKDVWLQLVKRLIREGKKHLGCAEDSCWESGCPPQLVCMIEGELHPEETFSDFLAWPIELTCAPPRSPADDAGDRCACKRIIRARAPDPTPLPTPGWLESDKVVIVIVSYSYDRDPKTKIALEEAQSVIRKFAYLVRAKKRDLLIYSPKSLEEEIDGDIKEWADMTTDAWDEGGIKSKMQEARVIWLHNAKPDVLYVFLRSLSQEGPLIIHFVGRVTGASFTLPFGSMPSLHLSEAVNQSGLKKKHIRLFYLSSVSVPQGKTTGFQTNALSFFSAVLRSLPMLEAGIGLRWAFTRNAARWIAAYFYEEYANKDEPKTVALALQQARHRLHDLYHNDREVDCYYAWLAPILVTFDHGALEPGKVGG